MSIKERTFSSNKTEKSFALTFVFVVVFVIFKCNYDHISDLSLDKVSKKFGKKVFLR